MKQFQELRLSQRLTLTPQLRQSIRLLQLSTAEFDQELDSFVANNPLLERDDAASDTSPPPLNGAAHEAHATAGETPAAGPAADDPREIDLLAEASSFRSGRDEDEDAEYPQPPAARPTLREHLTEQLALTRLSARDKSLIRVLIAALDDNGYLPERLEEIAAALPAELAVESEELAIALKYLQHFEPAGIGARSPAECLELQLLAHAPATATRALALTMVRSHLDDLAARDYAGLKRRLRCDDHGMRAALRLIWNLNPRPGAQFARDETRYVVPDVIVAKVKNHWTASLNPAAIPRLRINRLYAELLRKHTQASGNPMSNELQEARWLLRNVRQRCETILRVAQAIVDRQRPFLEHGEVAMRSLVMRDIAEALGLHESTVSRVTTQKFMSTPRGIFELKYFFSSHVATEAGGVCSATAIRALLKQLIDTEDRAQPLTDGRIAQILGEQGILVARRTVAKYRELMRLPPVHLRASL